MAVGYLFGLFQTSYIYGRLRGMDIREPGSGNAGATNARRTLGWKAGAITSVSYTHLDSTLWAIRSMTAPTVIILGGSYKKADYHPLAREMVRGNIAHAVLILSLIHI